MNDVLPLFPIILPSVPFNERETLPVMTAIYFALSHTGKVLYVGATRNLQQRWKAHNKLSALRDHGCAHIAYYLCSGDELAILEGAMIRQFHPLLNGPWSPIPAPRPRRSTTSFRLSQETVELLHCLAQNNGISPAMWLECGIREYAHRHGIK